MPIFLFHVTYPLTPLSRKGDLPSTCRSQRVAVRAEQRLGHFIAQLTTLTDKKPENGAS